MTTRPFEIRDDLRSLPPYRAPQVDAAIRLNTNESPWSPPEAVVQEFRDRIETLPINRYPDREATALRRGLGSRFGWPADGVWPANGSNEIIQTLLLAFGGHGRTVVVFEPTYAMHSHIAHVTGTTVESLRVDEPWVLSPDHVAATVARVGPAVTFICSPNNPTGTTQSLEVVEAALTGGPGLVVCDEAYGEFGGDSAVSILGKHDRLAVVRSFSKSWRMAGVRLGYVLAHPWLVEALQVVRLPYHLSALTQLAGEIAVKHAAATMSVIEEIVAERERLAKEMERVPDVRVFPSAANFLLFRTSWDGTALWKALAERGVLVRDFSALVPDCLRVTVGTADQNATFVETLRGTLAAQG